MGDAGFLSSSWSVELSMKDTFCGAMSSGSGAGTGAWSRLGRLGEDWGEAGRWTFSRPAWDVRVKLVRGDEVLRGGPGSRGVEVSDSRRKLAVAESWRRKGVPRAWRWERLRECL